MSADQGDPFIEGGRIKRRWSDGEITDHGPEGGPTSWAGSWIPPPVKPATPQYLAAVKAAEDAWWRRTEEEPGHHQPHNPFTERLINCQQLENQPDPVWLVDGLVPKSALTILYGKPGAYKSLLALDWSLCVASKARWMGHAVKSGLVVYVAAEGIRGTPKRKRAWEEHRDIKVEYGIQWLPCAVNLLDTTSVRDFIDCMIRLEPTLIVIDTLARCLVGGDENSARDMGLAVDACSRIIAAVEAAVVLIHHKGWNADHPRGSSALFGAADTVIEAAKESDGLLKLTVTKQKDAESDQELSMAVKKVNGSVVLDAWQYSAALRAVELDTARHCHEAFGSESFSSKEGFVASGLTERTYYRTRKVLVDRGFLIVEGTDARPRFKLTDKWLQLNTATHCQGDFGSESNTATKPSPYVVGDGIGSDRANADPVEGLF